jgi:hypothetical protein
MITFLLRSAIFAGLSLATSTAFGFAFSGPNPQPGSLTWNGASNGYGSVSISSNSGASYSSVLSGEFQGYFDPASEADAAGPEADDFLRFFCIDLFHYATTGPLTYTRSLGLDGSHTALDAAELSRLFDQFYPNASFGTFYSGGQTPFGNFPDATHSAAFQLAIWEIWYDSDMNLSTGTFRAAPSAVTTLAQSYLTAVGTGSTPALGWTLYEFNNHSNSQDYLSVTYSQPLRTVPEPGMLLLVGAGALAAWGGIKRRRQ